MHSLTVVIDALPTILAGCCVTVGNVFLSLFMGLILGVPLALGQVYGARWVRFLVGIYVWFFRGVPILVLLFLFYGLFISLGLTNNFLICCVVLGATSTAYQSQIYRGAIESLPQGQIKAALALGMNKRMAIANIVMPQALRLSLPGFANEFSILLKDSAICYVLGTQDIMARVSFAAARTHEHLALFACAGIIYFILTIVVLKLLGSLETRLHIPGYTGREVAA